MAGSRLEKFGTVFTRVRDLIRAGVVKQEERPIWFDVYAAFPPKKQPLHGKKVRPPRKPAADPVPEILYKEDEIRAKYFEVYGSGPKAFDLFKSDFVSPCQSFVMKYSNLESEGKVEPELLFEETAKVLLAEGVFLRKRGSLRVAPEPRTPLLSMKLSDMFAEQQSEKDIETDVPEKQPQAETVNPDRQTS